MSSDICRYLLDARFCSVHRGYFGELRCACLLSRACVGGKEAVQDLKCRVSAVTGLIQELCKWLGLQARTSPPKCIFMPSLSHLSFIPVHWNSNTVARSTHLSAHLRAFPHRLHLPHQAVGTSQSSVPPRSTPPRGNHSPDLYHHGLVLPIFELFPFCVWLSSLDVTSLSSIHDVACCAQLIFSHCCVIFTSLSLSFHMKVIDDFIFRSTNYLLSIWHVRTGTLVI